MNLPVPSFFRLETEKVLVKEKKSLRGKLRRRVAIATIAAVGMASSVAMAQPFGSGFGFGGGLPGFGGPGGGGFGQGGGGLQAHGKFRRVLLISVDGMHAVDLANCVNGVNGVSPFCPNLAALASNGVSYTSVSTSKPSDSFPGLMALVTGGSPKSTGVYYDVAYDRVLAPPTNTTGNGLAGGTCTPNVNNGTTTEYEEGIDLNKTVLNGGAPMGDGGVNSIDPTKLIRDPNNNCAPVYPWNFVRTNTIFGVIHGAGGYTAWSDKHPAYSAVSGPGATASNLDDFYAPEINSNVMSLPGVKTPNGFDCGTLGTVVTSGDYTGDFQAIQCYDQLKVNAIVNEINGRTHDGSARAPVPNIFGMNFQAVSVGQKLIENGVKGGYLDSQATPSTQLLSEFKFVDSSIGAFVSALNNRGLLDSTLIIITAKHGQSPIDPQLYKGIGTDGITTSPATILESMLPASESPATKGGIGPTEDDVSLIWLAESNPTELGSALSLLETTSNLAAAGIGEIFRGPALAINFNTPGLPPNDDPRTPDIIVTPNIGVTYSTSTKKQAEHGGFAHDDTNVVMLLSNPNFSALSVNDPVTTMQVAPTILRALGLDPGQLQAVQQEHTQVLPGVPLRTF
jgi:hypothetical protein